jgi:hypothetical protein
MKHSRISLVERAAEIYDFGSVLRGRAPAEAPVEPASGQPSVPPAAEPPEPAPVADPLVEFDFLVSAPAADEPSWTNRSRPNRPPSAGVRPVRHHPSRFAQVDRNALEAAGHIVPGAPATGLAEEFRLVKRQLLAGLERRISLPEEKRRSVLVCSAQSREGKTFCAINLALSLAGEQASKCRWSTPTSLPDSRPASRIPGLSTPPILQPIPVTSSFAPTSRARRPSAGARPQRACDVIRTDPTCWSGLSPLPGGSSLSIRRRR